MEKFLYLGKVSFIDAWINGGTVPLYVASTYKKEERGGIYTPDENTIDNSTHDRNDFKGLINIRGKNPVGVTFNNCFLGGHGYVPRVNFDIKQEDGLVLCLANSRSNYIAEKLNKVACVKICDVEKLKLSLDDQIGIVGEMGMCQYTDSHKRGHFLKSSQDSWQDEFRIFWPNAKNMEVKIPPNLAECVGIPERR